MSNRYKIILLFIYLVTVVLSVIIGYKVSSYAPLWLVVIAAIFVGAIIGSGYVRILIEPLQRRSDELELLSRQTLHELNLPVATISANIQMLLKNEKEIKNIKRLKRIQEASSVLKTLYSELDYMIKRHIHKVELQTVDLKDIIEHKVESYIEIFPQIRFKCNLETSIVKIDTIGFLKLLDNLVHNAVKYSKEGSVVYITLEKMQLSIKDEGVGMQDDFIVKAFEHYYQEDKKSSGQGLGLGVVKEYCDRYKIPIYVDSKKDRGTKISFNLTVVKSKNSF